MGAATSEAKSVPDMLLQVALRQRDRKKPDIWLIETGRDRNLSPKFGRNVDRPDLDVVQPGLYENLMEWLDRHEENECLR